MQVHRIATVLPCLAPRRCVLGIAVGLLFGFAVAQFPATIDLNSTAPLVGAALTRIGGERSGDALGADLGGGVAFGDIDGDGYDDLVCGAWLSGLANRAWSGGAYVIYGSATIAARQIDLAAPPPGTVTRFRHATGGELAGGAVACGDVNGDGFDDVVIGAMWGAGAAGKWSGDVYVIFGSATRIKSDLDLADAVAQGLGARVRGEARGDLFGYSLACGDLDGDGRDDLLVGATGWDPAGEIGPARGAGYLVYGTALIAGSDISLADAAGSHGETRILGIAAGDQVGCAIAAGDVNGDGYDDLILSGSNAAPANRAGAGAVYVVFGGPALPGTSLALSGTTVTLAETRIIGEAPRTRAGLTLACGDLNGDGLDDIAIGCPPRDAPLALDAGETVIIYGATSLRGRLIDLAQPNGSLGETRLFGSAKGEQTGMSLAVGDSNGDGLDDLLVGAWRASPGGRAAAGKLWLIAGAANLPGRLITLNDAAGIARILGDNPGDLFGCGARTGADMNGDGFSELAAAAPSGENLARMAETADAGRVDTVFASGAAMVGQAIESFKAGVAPRRGFGGRLSPALGCWLSFNGGDDGAGHATAVTVTRWRTRQAVSYLGGVQQQGVADAVWSIGTNRRGFSSASLRLEYHADQIVGLDETQLKLFHGPTSQGPWTEVSGAAFDLVRNQITAPFSSSGFYALGTQLGNCGSRSVTHEAIVRHLLGQQILTGASLIEADVNADGRVDIADVLMILNLCE